MRGADGDAHLRGPLLSRDHRSETGEVLPEGSKGELVFTSLDKEALPPPALPHQGYLRALKKPCSCGRTLVKMSKPLGRSDDMLIIRGVNVSLRRSKRCSSTTATKPTIRSSWTASTTPTRWMSTSRESPIWHRSRYRQGGRAEARLGAPLHARHHGERSSR